MSLIKSEYSVKHENDEWSERFAQMSWKVTHSNREDEKYPNWSAEFKNEWIDKIGRITEEQRNEGSETIDGKRNERSLKKTQDQIEMEKILHRKNSLYKTLQLPACHSDKMDTNLKKIVLVAERYPREDLKGLSEEELIGKDEKRNKEGELTTKELRRWKRFSKREAVYSLTPENFEMLKRRFELGRQLQNPNYEEIRSRRPQMENRGGLQDNRSRPRSPSITTPSCMSSDRAFQDRLEEKRRSMISRSRSKSPRRSNEVDRRREPIRDHSLQNRERNEENEERRRAVRSRSRSKSPARSIEVSRRREPLRDHSLQNRDEERRRSVRSRSRSKSPARSIEVSRRREPLSDCSLQNRNVERRPSMISRSRSKSPTRSIVADRRLDRSFQNRNEERRRSMISRSRSRSPSRSIEIDRRRPRI